MKQTGQWLKPFSSVKIFETFLKPFVLHIHHEHFIFFKYNSFRVRLYLKYWQQRTYNKAHTLKELFIEIICYYFNGISMYHDQDNTYFPLNYGLPVHSFKKNKHQC